MTAEMRRLPVSSPFWVRSLYPLCRSRFLIPAFPADGHQGILVAQGVKRDAGGKHRPGGIEKDVGAFIGAEVLLKGTERRDGVQDKHRAVREALHHPQEKK